MKGGARPQERQILPRRVFRHASAKAMAALFLSVLIAGPYFLLQYFPLFEATMLAPSAWDDALPFVPGTMWIYQSLYPLLVLAGLLAPTLRILNQFAKSMLLCAAAAFVVFLIFPTAVPRPVQTEGLFGIWTLFEKSSNALPSLHAAFCVLLLLFLPQVVKTNVLRLCYIWILAILISTLTTKQHILVDLAAGSIPGCFAYLFTRSKRPDPRTVLLVTGSSLDPSGSLLGGLLRMASQLQVEKHKFFSLKVKAVIGEALLYSRLIPIRRYPAFINQYFRKDDPPPSLTHVLLEELLAREGLRVLHLTVSEVHERPFLRRACLRRACAVFVSTTLLHDLSELTPILHRLKRPWNRLIAGGAMTGSLPRDWQGTEEIDLVSMGYGESAVPSLAQWIRSGFLELKPPKGGRIEERKHSVFLHCLPEGTSLDALAAASWKRAIRRSPNRMIYYESVRGCPYRCGFCNYPFLFADTRFRYRSARTMFEDWKRYAELDGVQIINCLDSLFTMPKKRLHEFCSLLVQNPLPVRWICYARADDLDLETAAMMKAAGAMQAHIGIESGDPRILVNMNKQTTVESNAAALENCRKTGITSIATLVVGYPGETEETLQNTFEFLKAAPPDFHFLAAFSTRVAGVPVLSEENRERFGLVTDRNLYTMSPYWKHRTMSCAEAGLHLRKLTRSLIEERISLDAAIFYGGILDYLPEHRAAMLDFQKDAFSRSRGKPVFDMMHQWIDARLERDVRLLTEAGPGT
jgi:anaerobic magnesium-protoporphyrin IX monomethyl ester cyclase